MFAFGGAANPRVEFNKIANKIRHFSNGLLPRNGGWEDARDLLAIIGNAKHDLFGVSVCNPVRDCAGFLRARTSIARIIDRRGPFCIRHKRDRTEPTQCLQGGFRRLKTVSGTGRRNELLGRRFRDCASPRHSNLGVAPRYRRSRLVVNRARDRAGHSTGRNRITMRTEPECRD